MPILTAKTAPDAFGTEPLKQCCQNQAWEIIPEVIRFMYRAGKAISEDSYVGNQVQCTRQ